MTGKATATPYILTGATYNHGDRMLMVTLTDGSGEPHDVFMHLEPDEVERMLEAILVRWARD